MSRSTLIRAAVAGLVTAATVAGPVPAAGAQPEPAEPATITWGVVPSSADGPDGRVRFDYKLDPGAELVDYVAVSNHSTAELTVALYASDALSTADGGFDLLPAAEPPTGVGTWIELDSPHLTIPPRSRMDVPFRLAVPANATPGDHAGGLVASLVEPGTGPDGGRVQVEHRVGARIYLRVTGELRPALTVVRFEPEYAGTLHPSGTGSLTATYTVRNTGNVRLTGTPRLTVSGPFGLGRRSMSADPLPELLPGAEFTASAAVDGVAPLVRLTTTVTVIPEPVDGQPLRPAPPVPDRTVRLWALPWGQLLLVLLVAAGVTGWWWQRRRGRRRVAAQLAEAREQGRTEARAESEPAEFEPAEFELTEVEPAEFEPAESDSAPVAGARTAEVSP